MGLVKRPVNIMNRMSAKATAGSISFSRAITTTAQTWVEYLIVVMLFSALLGNGLNWNFWCFIVSEALPSVREWNVCQQNNKIKNKTAITPRFLFDGCLIHSNETNRRSQFYVFRRIWNRAEQFIILISKQQFDFQKSQNGRLAILYLVVKEGDILDVDHQFLRLEEEQPANSTSCSYSQSVYLHLHDETWLLCGSHALWVLVSGLCMLSQTWFAYLHIQQLQSNIIIHLESCVLPSDESKSDIHSLLAQFLVSIPLYSSCRNKIWFYSVKNCRCGDQFKESHF